MRDLTKVIDQLLAVIPQTETALRVDLEKVQYKAIYTAPEQMLRRFRHTQAILERGAGPRELWPEWREKTVEIWNGKEQPA